MKTTRQEAFEPRKKRALLYLPPPPLYPHLPQSAGTGII
jgi:hypothetical protein